MSAMDILSLAAAFRAAVTAREEAATAEIVNAYITIYEALEGQLDDLLSAVAVRREAGLDVSMAWIRRQQRLEALVEQVEREIASLASQAEDLITSGQRDLVTMGQAHAEQLMRVGMGTPPPNVTLSFNRLNAGAVETMVGFLTPGTPLREALDRLPDMASQDVRDALIRGIGTGQHPRVVARSFREALGGNAVSAEKLARTAQLNSYRESNRQTFQENSDVVTGWRWVAAIDSPRTCMSCIVKHGQVFPLDEPMREHWNGRCAQVAVTKSWAELGFENVPDTRPQIESGIEWFERQSPAVQLRRLGPGKYAAWRDGQFDLADLSVAHNDAIWGEMYQEASLKGMLGIERARLYYGGKTPLRDDLPLAADD